MTLWFISDTHFGHSNIIKYAGRPFSDVDHMNEMLIQNWNAVVRPSDHVYHLGDVALKGSALQLVKRLTGKKRLILGNHDNETMKTYTEVGFQKIMGARVFDGMTFTHYPIHGMSATQNGEGKLIGNVHGHIHERPSPPGPYVNVSVEWTDYRPLTLEEVKKRMQKGTP